MNPFRLNSTQAADLMRIKYGQLVMGEGTIRKNNVHQSFVF
jgi:hypothetical protein